MKHLRGMLSDWLLYMAFLVAPWDADGFQVKEGINKLLARGCPRAGRRRT